MEKIHFSEEELERMRKEGATEEEIAWAAKVDLRRASRFVDQVGQVTITNSSGEKDAEKQR